jgi:hypothetical protein
MNMPRTKNETPKTTKAPKNGDKNGGRKKAADQIKTAWQQAGTWPVKLSDKVRIWTPKGLRGMQAKVIAVGDAKADISSRKAPEGKIRVYVKDADAQFCVTQAQVFPNGLKVKDIQAL